MDAMQCFLELYGQLPRAGPGDSASTRRAFELIESLPERPLILDLGCGPGVQAADLLHYSAGTVIAVDILPLMVDRSRQLAEQAALADRLRPLLADMNNLPFARGAFDLIWSEGAIYNLGFESGLESIRRWVKPQGWIVVSEVVWLQTSPPQELREFWQAYPEIDTPENKCRVIERLGYRLVDHFVLPAQSWTEHYYDPLESRAAILQEKWRDMPEADAVLAEARCEIEMFKKYSEFYSYAFFVMQRQQ